MTTRTVQEVVLCQAGQCGASLTINPGLNAIWRDCWTGTVHHGKLDPTIIQLERLNQNKASGPYGFSPRVLKACAEQLCGILQHIFHLSLGQECVPRLWKTSCLMSLPKFSSPATLNDYRSVLLTSDVLTHLRPGVEASLYPLQFTNCPKVGVDNARELSHTWMRPHCFLTSLLPLIQWDVRQRVLQEM